MGGVRGAPLGAGLAAVAKAKVVTDDHDPGPAACSSCMKATGVAAQRSPNAGGKALEYRCSSNRQRSRRFVSRAGGCGGLQVLARQRLEAQQYRRADPAGPRER